MHRIVSVITAVLFLLISIEAQACRYSVREVGFVDLNPTRYTLYVYVDDNVPADQVTLIKRIVFLELMDTPIELEMVHVDQDTGHLGLEYLAQTDFETYPTMIMVSPEGYTWPKAVSDGSEDLKGEVESFLMPFATSPLRAQILSNLPHFCTVLYLEGADENSSKTTEAAISSALETVVLHMPDMDKATDLPPVLLKVSVEDAIKDPVLLWSLGLEASDLDIPRVVVLFGKARRMGSVLRGDRITEDELVKVMGLIGASCECGLDRKWMQGTMIPMEWNDDTRQQLVEHLGFDPDSPLIKTEMSQIIAKGMGAHEGSGSKVNEIFDYQEHQVTQAESTQGEVPLMEDVPLEKKENIEEVVAPVETMEVVEAPEPVESAGIPRNVLVVVGLLVLINVICAIFVLRKRGGA